MSKKYIYLLILTAFATNLEAQIVGDDRTELLKPFQAKLANSKKFESRPYLVEVDSSETITLNYEIPEHLMSLSYPAPKIRPLAMPKPPKLKDYHFFAKAGFGYPLSPMAAISYHNQFKQFKLGFNADHRSVLQGYLDNQQYSQTHADINGTYFFDKFALGAAVNFDYNTNRFYGVVDSLENYKISEDSLKQAFVNVDANLHLFNIRSSSLKLNYKGQVAFHSYSDRYGSREISVSPYFELEKWFGKKQQMHPLRVKLGMNYLDFKDKAFVHDSVTYTSSKEILYFYFNPTFTINAGAFKARFGTNLGVNEAKFFIHPDVELSYSLAKGAIDLYAGAVGQVRTNNYRNLTQYNRFLISYPEIRHSNYLELFGGLRGAVKKIEYKLEGGYALVQDQPYFLNDDRDSFSQFSRFYTVYDTCSIIFINAGLDFRLVKHLLIGGILSYKIYQSKNFEKAFHLPTFESNFFIHYNLFFNNKKARWESNYLSLRGEFFINAGLPYLDENSIVQVLQGLYDINFMIRYQATKNFAVFAELNNLIHNRNQRWYLYRQLGFNGMIGLEIKF